MNFLILLLSTSLVMSLIMIGVMIFFKISDSSFTAKTRYTIWIILLLGLLIPFRPTIGSGLITIKSPIHTLSSQTEILIKDNEISNQYTNLQTNLSEENYSSDHNLAVEKPVLQNTSIENSNNIFFGLSIMQIATFIWFIGFILTFSKKLLEYNKFHKLIKRWGNIIEDENTLNIFRQVKSKMNITQEISLISCKFISTPMLTGLFNPIILLPKKNISNDELSLIFEHELTHYKHKDLFVNLLSMCVLSLHWFNPILYLCLPTIQGDGESYCDETVLKNRDVHYRRFYGETILSMISITPSKQIALSTCFYNKKLNLKRRLLNIMKTNKNIKKLSLASIAAVLSLTILSGSVIVFATPNTKTTTNTTKSTSTVNQAGLIGVEKAKSIALSDAGLKSANVSFIKAKLDTDDNVQVYDVEFYSGNKEYDYEIDAKTGSIREKDTDIENYSIPTTKQNNTTNTTKSTSTANQTGLIGVEKAKSIALSDAGLKSANVSFIKAKLDTDDNVQVYDVEFYSGNKEYDYEIDAKTGSIREKDTDIENYSIPTTKQNNTTNTTKSTSTTNQVGLIGVEKAKSIALSDAGLKSANVSFTKAKLDTDDNVQVYDVEFYSGNKEYDYEIDAKTGSIRESDVDIED